MNWNDPSLSVSAPQMRQELDKARDVYARAESQGWDRIPPHELMRVTVAIMERCLTMMEVCYAIAETAEQAGIIGKNIKIHTDDFQLALASQGFMTKIIAAVIAAAVRGGLIQVEPERLRLTADDMVRLITEMGLQLEATQPKRTVH
jgi:hypothetical protein